VAARGISIYEFDAIVQDGAGAACKHVPANVFAWLEQQCLRGGEDGGPAWLRLTQREGNRAVQVTSYVGVIRAPSGFQIEVLPKLGKADSASDAAVRTLLIDMLCCLQGFRHIRTDSAHLSAKRMPLFEVFVREFLLSVQHIVKRGLRSTYVAEEDHLFKLRGRLLISQQVRQNLHRADRFFTAHDEFSTDRPENRLLHAALRRVMSTLVSPVNLQLARELCLAFADVPPSKNIGQDFQRVQIDRGMGYYVEAVAWARLILENESPLTGVGANRAPSLLFPMEAVFEAFVTKHLARQLRAGFTLKAQAQTHHLVSHIGKDWFKLKPDLLIRQNGRDFLVLDTKWKLLDSSGANGSEKYGLSQSDFYQLYAYGHHYLEGKGDIVLIYPRTGTLDDPLPVFDFPKAAGMRLWVLPFCLRERQLKLPTSTELQSIFVCGRVVSTKKDVSALLA